MAFKGNHPGLVCQVDWGAVERRKEKGPGTDVQKKKSVVDRQEAGNLIAQISEQDDNHRKNTPGGDS